MDTQVAPKTIASAIQATDHAVYFHEQWKGPGIRPSGKFFKLDLDSMQTEEIQFADAPESESVTVSQSGKYIATVRDMAPPGADFTQGSIKIYDGQTLSILRQIDLERGFPRLVIDETNRSLIACFLVDGTIKLMRYVF